MIKNCNESVYQKFVVLSFLSIKVRFDQIQKSTEQIFLITESKRRKKKKKNLLTNLQVLTYNDFLHFH